MRKRPTGYVLSFNCFKLKLETGKKTQTIRLLGKREIKVGDKLHIWWKQRSAKNREKLGVSVCVSVRNVKLWNVTDEEAIRDGFDGRLLLWDWFNKNYPLEANLKGTWQVIRWNFPFVKNPCLTCKKYPCDAIRLNPNPPVCECDLWEKNP